MLVADVGVETGLVSEPARAVRTLVRLGLVVHVENVVFMADLVKVAFPTEGADVRRFL